MTPAFERVVIPHTNVRLPWHNFDDKTYEFVSTYRRRFKTPAAARGKRVFIDFEGAMTASTVWINGTSLGEYKGGFTPFSFELTPHLRQDGENVLVVQLDSTERDDIPPFGNEIDYLTFGGIYREVSLRIVPATYLDNIFARPTDVLSGKPSLDVDCFVTKQGTAPGALSLEVELRDGERTLAKGSGPYIPGARPIRTPRPIRRPARLRTAARRPSMIPNRHTVTVNEIGGIKLWDLENPHLYTVHVRLLQDGQVIDAGYAEDRLPRSDIHRSRLLAQWQDHQAARTRPSSDISLCRPGDAGARAAPGRDHPAQESALQHRPHVALSAVAPLSRCLRRNWPAGAGRDSRLAAHRAANHGSRSRSTTSAA